MKMTFDLITRAWIPIIRGDGTAAEVGLREALHSAHEMRVVRDPLPTVEFGIHRLLVALALDIFQPQDVEALGGLLENGRFDAGRIDAYFTQWHDRFDLFSASHPFLQTEGMDGEPGKPLAGLLHPMPSGTNAAHFHHGHEEQFGVGAPAAARLLTTIAPFMTAGGAGLSPSINGAPPWYSLVLGETLFETVCLNIYVLDTQKYPLGIPAWRDDRPLVVDRCTKADLLEALTWRPRRIQIVPGDGGVCALTGIEEPILVRTMKFAPGVSCGFPWRDPSVPYKADDKGERVVRPQEGRPVWRDTAPLALLHEADYRSGDNPVRFTRPYLLDQFQQIVRPGDGYLPRDTPLRMTLYALRTDLKMKTFEWHREELSLPRDLVLQDKFHRDVMVETNRAGEVARAIRSGVKLTYDREGAGNKSAFETLIGHAERQFWGELRPHFDDLLTGLAALSAVQKAEANAVIEAWQVGLRRVAQAAFEDAVGDLDADAEALRRQVMAGQAFRRSLTFALATDEERAAWKARKNTKAKAAPAAAQGELVS